MGRILYNSVELPFGANVRARRLEMGLTQVELARRIGGQLLGRHKKGVSQPYMNQIESGDITPSLPMALAISRVIGVGLDELCREK